MKNKKEKTKIKTRSTSIKKMAISASVFVLFFVLAGILKTKAGTSENVTGWLWSNSDDGSTNSAVGSISMNSVNVGGGASYGVNIPSSDGDVTGYAWSENLGYIDFAPVGPYPVAPAYSVRRVGNSLDGWARFVEIQNASAAGNSGGWQGWIKMSGPGYGVTIDPATGKLIGYAWSDELGSISFRGAAQDGAEYGAQIPMPPIVSLNSDVMAINLDGGALPKTVTLSWTVSGATSCTKSVISGSATWSGSLSSPATGSESVSQSDPNTTYKLSCSGPGGTTDATVFVTTGCNKKACAANACASTFTVTGTSSDAVCVSGSSCTSDSDCAPREAQSWREVSPN